MDELASSIVQDDLYADYWLHIPNAVLATDRTRVVSVYEPGTGAASTGYLTVDRPMSTTEIFNSAVIELHGMVNPKDFTELINQGLKMCFLVTEFVVPAVSGQQRHRLDIAAPWLLDERWARQAGWLNAGEAREQVNPYNGRAIYGRCTREGRAIYLEHDDQTFSEGQDLYVRAIKRAYDHCKATGTAVQTITLYGTPTGGTFTITYLNDTTTALAYNASAAIVQTALRLLPDLGSVTVTGTGPWVVTLTGAGTEPPLMITTDDLSGGTDPYSAVADTTGEFGTQSGLSAETDEAPVDELWVAFATLVTAARRAQTDVAMSVNPDLIRNEARWAGMFSTHAARNFTLPYLALQPRRFGSFGPQYR